MPRLVGTVRFPPGERPAIAAAVVSVLEDVTVADAPSSVLASDRQEAVTLPPQDEQLPFELEVPADLDPRRRYNVRVHIDVSGTGTVTHGDFVTVRAYPVESPSESVSVEVHAV